MKSSTISELRSPRDRSAVLQREATRANEAHLKTSTILGHRSLGAGSSALSYHCRIKNLTILQPRPPEAGPCHSCVIMHACISRACDTFPLSMSICMVLIYDSVDFQTVIVMSKSSGTCFKCVHLCCLGFFRTRQLALTHVRLWLHMQPALMTMVTMAVVVQGWGAREGGRGQKGEG